MLMDSRFVQNRSRCSANTKNEEWCWRHHRRASGESLSGLRPQQETLLTYAGEMTGWQSSWESGGMPSMHQEAIELSRTVSHLATANQQLASAHATLLGQLESLYLELNRERELRKERDRESTTARITSSSSEYENEREKVCERVGNSEFAARIIREANFRCKHFRYPLLNETPNKSFSTRDIGVQSATDLDDRSADDRFEQDEPHYRLSSGLTNDEKSSKSNVNNDLSLEYKKAVDRIEMLENELTISCVNSIREIEANEINTRSKRSLNETRPAGFDESDSKNTDQKKKYEVVDTKCGKDFAELLQEVEKQRSEKLHYRSKNEKLMADLENRNFLVASLTSNCENSRSQSEKLESNMIGLKKRFDALIMEYESGILEKTKVSKELKMCKFERDTANLRIADLEKELAKLSAERSRKIENEESSRLKETLSDETTSRKDENARALEEALVEIQRLKDLIENSEDSQETRRGGGAATVTENESSPEEEEEEEEEETISDPEMRVARTSNMEEFRKELSLKREARQRAIAAVSSEMDRLRRELDAEKEAHSETSRVLDLLKSGQSRKVATKHEAIDEDVPTGSKEDLRDTNDWRKIMKADPKLDNNEADAKALTDILKVSDELKTSIRLQTEKIDDLRYHLECETEDHQNRIASLKEIAKMSRESSGLRERQTNKLKNLLAQILTRLGDPRFRVDINDYVRTEHDRQIEDITRLKSLYDDRLRILVDLRETATKELKDVKEKLKISWKENRGLEEDLKKAEEKIDSQDTEISNLESQLGLTKADCRDLQNQMSVINGLFTQMLLGASSADMDLDRLTRLLQENHDLISDMAREEGTEAAALPKLLLDIVEQVEGRGAGKSEEGDNEKKEEDRQEENIAHNLPKVWRVLLELLSCHAAESTPVTPASLSTDPNSCYKSVDTPSGPRLVISVSKTYIRLKELILEKKHLEKEMNRMKTLNTHLESKLGEQEKRLSTVSSELNKTWNIVGRMQAQHQQLHTHEKILRYELQQKRKMLQELKQELEYCREKWESARQKNTNTEMEWRSLRREFAARKSLVAQDSFNNSAESGFSDERGDDSDEDEDETLGERVRIGPRRRARKENPRAPSPDTESEQPTDTELSETKTTPETNVSTEDVSIASTSENYSTDKLGNEESAEVARKDTSENLGDEGTAEPMINKLDEALTNVIQNLIIVDRSSDHSSRVSMSSSENEDDGGGIVSSSRPTVQSKQSEKQCNSKYNGDDKHEGRSVLIINNNQATDSNESSKLSADIDTTTNVSKDEPSICAYSIFSIGPFPTSASGPAASAKSVQFSDPLIVGPSTAQSALAPLFGERAVLSEMKNPEKADEGFIDRNIEEEVCHNMGNRVDACSKNCEEAIGAKQEESSLNRVPVVGGCRIDSLTNERVETICDPTITISSLVDNNEQTKENVRVENYLASCSSNPEAGTNGKITENELPAVVVADCPSTCKNEIITTAESPSKDPPRSHEQVLAARAARLKRLEEQADWLMKKMNATNRRGSALCNRLEELHEVYGEAPVPPPMPDVLPTLRIPLQMRQAQQEPEDETRIKSSTDEKPPPDSP
ncbi:uncharacterized protein PFB0765w isoform X2 [Venturia canescens]|uniref:uncharacterized protein PFB0765w isoform X2 n=1 Tax=Venturia canescens TaxID=32260 RepID=UPI001C9C7B15|nr:uncharacterized protein PFB0765w isoform X2 [Venturia canescens]